MWEEKKKLHIHWREVAVNQDTGVCVGVVCCHCLCKLWEGEEINKSISLFSVVFCGDRKASSFIADAAIMRPRYL